MQRLQAEQLEGREVMSAVSFTGGVLSFTASDNYSVVLLADAGGGRVQATYDLGDGNGFQVETFNGVGGIVFQGGNGNDTFLNQTAVSDFADGGAGSDVLLGGTGASSTMSGGDGTDVLIFRAESNSVGQADDDYILFL